MADLPGAVLLGLAPMACFLAALVLLDSYRLVRLRLVLAVVAWGMATAGLGYLANGVLLNALAIGFAGYSRYVAPFVEEILKAAVIVALMRTHRIGFLVDAAILGFAAGAGFALVENLLYLVSAPQAGMGVWMVRGFGTAIMHGGATAIFAVAGVGLRGGQANTPAWALAPGLVVAVALHSVFNHFFLSPFASTLGVAIVLPIVLHVVFARSEAAVGDWLGSGFDANAETLDLIASGRIADTPIGSYLQDLRSKLDGPIVADVLCYLRLHTELALRAKGVLLMRENGFAVEVDAATREKFAEMSYLEKSIGRTSLIALQPLVARSSRDLWQLHALAR
jgi:RsiW-degrading membrane proteinase PrsW (M82 family)